MFVRKIDPRELKVIKYDGTNLNAVKQFIEKECDTEIYREGKHDGNPYLDVSGGYTLFLNEGMYIVQHLDLYGHPSGFYDYHSLEGLKSNFVITEKDKSE